MLLIILLNIDKNKDNEDVNEMRSIFISYIELSEYIKDKDYTTSKNNIDTMINNIKKFNLNTIILQVRISSDAIYSSKI